MTIDELKALDARRAAAFYRGVPDGQWDKEAATFLDLAPELLALFEAAYVCVPGSYASAVIQGKGELYEALGAFEKKLHTL